MNLAKRFEDGGVIEPAMVSGFPGFTITVGGELSSVTSAEVVDGAIVRILTVMNPEKLAAVRHRPVDGDGSAGSAGPSGYSASS
ncbi:MAG: hypothetical protein R2710_13545 [Acidimicrobiales bacterium]